MTAGTRLRVDPIACDGRRFCAEILPELITLDDWGFPLIRDADVPAALLAEAGEAVRLCPMLALRLDRAARRPRGGPEGTARQDHRPLLPGRPGGLMEVTGG
jgi:ferredoxin